MELQRSGGHLADTSYPITLCPYDGAPVPPLGLAIPFADATTADLVICFSHLRWAFVYQRPQHLMSRFSASLPVLYFEEPIDGGEAPSRIDIRQEGGVWVAVPVISSNLDDGGRNSALAALLDECIATLGATNPIFWFYTPMMLPFTRHREPAAIVYDCMDELANFDFAPQGLRELEGELMAKANVVFTGGRSLYEARQDRHPNIHLFPSSVDTAHFAKARELTEDPIDQRDIPHPRLGFFGVIDERFDAGLIKSLAQAHPEWSIVLVGPIVKIDPQTLASEPNVCRLGAKSYRELPDYLAGWDVALMPFALNAATKFISPTKTPEYLAGGKPVVSTAIRDVVTGYGELKTVSIAANTSEFTQACDQTLSRLSAGSIEFASTDELLKGMSWDATASGMLKLMKSAVAKKRASRNPQSAPAIKRKIFDAVVVGAGFAGAVMAERLAAGSGKRVLVIDRRDHIAGNAYDYFDDAGVQVHAYGPHIFHTNSPDIFKYLSRFTAWRPYEHRVHASVGSKLVPIPINRQTLNELFGLLLSTDDEAKAYLATRAEPRDPIETSEDVVINAVGRELYEMFFRGYTRKQWGLDPSELNRTVTARIPTRTSLDDRYFTDIFQAIPRDGYTAMFAKMLDHPNISVELGVDYEHVRKKLQTDLTVYTGPIDAFFGHRYGPLPYRSLRFEHATLDYAQHQSVGTINHPSEATPYTRVSEFKHITGQSHSKTSIVYEYPSAEGDPYYPIPQPKNDLIYQRYSDLAALERDTVFVGRLATYRYYNMDQVVGQALASYRRLQSTQQLDDVASSRVIAAQ